jgi:hypothetical protein
LENKNLEKYRKKNGESKEKTKSMKRKTAWKLDKTTTPSVSKCKMF